MLALPIDIWIVQAEKNWLHALYSHAEEVFQNTFLPSHDQSHHLRVWNISKQLLKEISTLHSFLTPAMVEGVLIASFFHDLGMVESTREDHGNLGMELCRSWFSENAYPAPSNFDRILEAIELHDRKEARIYPAAGTPPGILGILSVADDLEALGLIGIYRYAEIYLCRGISLEHLGTRIRENAEHRFSNLSSSPLAPGIIGEYEKQFHELTRFYAGYMQELQEVDQPEKSLDGHLGVINYIRTRGISQKIHPEDLAKLAQEEEMDPVIQEYFSSLKNELEKKRA